MEFSKYGPIPQEVLEHLKNEKPQHFAILDDMSVDMTGINYKTERLLQEIQEHMMKCGTCLGSSIDAGLLISIEDYWQHHPAQIDGIPLHIGLNYN